MAFAVFRLTRAELGLRDVARRVGAGRAVRQRIQAVAVARPFFGARVVGAAGVVGGLDQEMAGVGIARQLWLWPAGRGVGERLPVALVDQTHHLQAIRRCRTGVAIVVDQ